jgi:hypothetical protein
MLYNIHLSIIQQISPVFRDIFAIPVSTGEGTEANPIFLEQIKQAEFDDFLLWIYKM